VVEGGADRFARAMQIVSQKCVSCHSPGGSAADYTSYLNAEAAWVSANLVVPKSSRSSLLYQYLQHSGFTPAPLGTMPVGGSLSDQELTTFREWIDLMDPPASLPNGPATGFLAPPPLARIKERAFIKSVLDDVFGGADGLAQQITTTMVLNQLTKFGGPCDPMGLAPPPGEKRTSCGDVDSAAFSGPITPLSSVPREGQRMKTCNVLCFNDTTLQNAIMAATDATDLSYLANAPLPSRDQIVSAYQLFYPGPPALPDSLVDALVAVAQAAQNPSSSLDPWRAVLLVLCYTPDWQVP
jgi:hypothetical protein